MNKRFLFASDARGSKLMYASMAAGPVVDVTYRVKNKHEHERFVLEELIDVKGWKAIGNKFPVQSLVKVEEVETKPKEEPKSGEAIDLEQLKDQVKDEVQEEDDQQLGLFKGGKPDDS